MPSTRISSFIHSQALSPFTSSTAPFPSALLSRFVALSLSLQQPPTRYASILANLSDNPGAYQRRIRKGRGPSSGYGKTAGRGHKGQKQHGKVRPWFQGGQTPLIKVYGRKGFINHQAPVMAEVNLDRIQAWVDAGRLNPREKITPRELIRSGCVSGRIKDGIKVLGRRAEALKSPIDLLVSRASSTAIDAIERNGGKIVTRFFTKASIARLVKGESEITDQPLPVGPEHVQSQVDKMRSAPPMYRLPDPTNRWDIEYYRDPAHRGYLSHQLKPGESPSLYFKVPREMSAETMARIAKKKTAAKKEEPRIF